jgi:radical SAM superfamily enzyme YgiQ (UPF0313 family)
MRIALIALSGIRPDNRARCALGRTLAGIVDRWEDIESLPSLALLTLAGMTGDAHEYRYFEVETAEDAANLPDDIDLAAISSYTAKIRTAWAIAARYRALGVPVVMGGPHVSCLPEEAARHCDAVVIGEGEPVWPRLLEDAEAGRLQPFYGDLSATFDLAESPMPAWELLDIGKYNRIPVQTSRGCPHRCEFCASSVLIANKYKQKPAERVLAEIDRIKTLWRRPFIEFADDNSFINFRYWKELLRALKSRRVRWFTQTDLSVARDTEMLELMRDSGCVQVLIGFESPNEEDLRGLEMKSDWKSRHFRDSAEAIARLQSYGISVLGCFVLGMDTQGPECFDAVYRFARETELYDVQITVLTPFPGTPLYSRLKAEGRLLEEEAWRRCTLYDVNFQPAKMTPEELDQGFNDLLARIYSEEETRWRRNCFRKHLRNRVRQRMKPADTAPE